MNQTKSMTQPKRRVVKEKKLSKSGAIKQGICPHCEIKLPAFNEKHRSTCEKCGHVFYYKSDRAIGCLTCLGRVGKTKETTK